MKKLDRVTPSLDERQQLRSLSRRGHCDARRLRRARVLLLADQSEHGLGWHEAAVADAMGFGHRAVERQRCVEDSLDAVLENKPAERVCHVARL